MGKDDNDIVEIGLLFMGVVTIASAMMCLHIEETFKSIILFVSGIILLAAYNSLK